MGQTVTMASGLGMQGDQITKEDVRRVEHEESAGHKAGNIPAGSDAAAMQSMMDKQNQNKGDFNSADASTVNVGSGGVSDTFSKGNDALREPATGDSAVRTDGNAFMVNTKAQGVGREAIEGGLPNDAVARDAKDKAGLADTTNKDYGYPQKNDPTS